MSFGNYSNLLRLMFINFEMKLREKIVRVFFWGGYLNSISFETTTTNCVSPEAFVRHTLPHTHTYTGEQRYKIHLKDV